MPNDPLMDTPANEPFAEVLAKTLQAEEQGQAPDLERLIADFPDLESKLRRTSGTAKGSSAWPRT